LCKPYKPITPTRNGRNAPACNIGKYLTKQITEFIHLPDSFNVKNTDSLIKAGNNVEVDKNTYIPSSDMCTNIPPTELHDIENALKTVIL
jgi:hypothetical protein